MTKTNKKIISALIATQLIFLSGCGTLQRADSASGTYRGFEMDKQIATNPYFWMFSLGIAPIFSIISMPLDIVIDTVLYPYDTYKEKQLMGRIKNDPSLQNKTSEVIPN